MHRGNPQISDVVLRDEGVVRIYDIFFEYDVLLSTDEFYRKMIEGPEFQRDMCTAEFHYLAGKYVAERERVLGIEGKSLLAAAYEAAVPVYTSSPGDSSIGMNVAAKALTGNKLRYDVNADVNETASIVLDAKRSGGKSAVLIFGGGSPKNFLLQTEPQIQEVLKIEEKGHDYFLQVTDARPDTGGLVGSDSERSGLVGQDRPGSSSRRRCLLSRFDDRAADHHVVRAGASQAAKAETALRSSRRDDEAAYRRARASGKSVVRSSTRSSMCRRPNELERSELLTTNYGHGRL